MDDIAYYEEYTQLTAVEELGIDTAPDEDHKYCICGEFLNLCKDAYSHMSSGV